MKKTGFTLVEILVTLSIVGILAAITVPTLVNGTSTARAGSALSKATSVFESATEAMIVQKGMPNIMSCLTTNSGVTINEVFGDTLKKYLKISYYATGGTKYGKNGTSAQVTYYNGSLNSDTISESADYNVINILDNSSQFISKDGFLYAFNLNRSYTRTGFAGEENIGFVVIDINGISSPNRLGQDIFCFALYNDGRLKPMGSSFWFVGNDEYNSEIHWKDGTLDQCNNTVVNTGHSCAGSIFENNMTVIY